MFDDDIINCEYLKRSGVNFCMMCTKLNYNYRSNLPYVTNWHELYQKIVEIKKE